MFNKEKLQEALVGYKKDFTSGWWEAEKYKWEAIKTFQDNWAIDATDFADMLSRSLAKTENLLTARNYLAREMIKELAQTAPEKVRGMFRALFNERNDVADRILAFMNQADEFVAKQGDKKKHSFQDLHAIATYLWLRFPDKYYIFKIKEVKNVAKILEYEHPFTQGQNHYYENIKNFYSFYDEICEYISKDSELIKLLQSGLTESCYPDSQYRTLATDIAYHIGCRNFPSADPKKEQIISQEPTRIWKISHGTDATGIKKELRKVFAERHVVVVDGATKAVASSKTPQGEMFTKQIKKGDYFYLCYGNNVQLLGQFISDEALPNEEIDGTWCERKYKVIAQAKNKSKYKGEKKWWTPNYNSTCIPIGEQDEALFESLILKPYFDMTLNELFEVKPTECNYWWLNANPSIWSFSGIKVDEVQIYTLISENGHKRRIYQNFLDARVGDKVIGYEATPTKQIIALCEIVEEQNGENIKFKKTETLTTPIDYSTLKEYPELAGMEVFVNSIGSLFRLTKDEYDFLMDRIRELNSPPTPPPSPIKPYTKKDFLGEVFMSETAYDKNVRLLRNKKNIILQGAPGVGKTYAANRLAYSIMGERDTSRVEIVQFHQNYSYEDFIMGYRPSGDGFDLKTGKFYNFCTKAANKPNSDFFFIIDEINRGNMSKIFGELLMLIENDYRGESLSLAYDGRPFYVPKNLYIIGMMNTADRSLAMIDYALRRRFSFIEMCPAFDSEGFKQYQKSLNNEMFDQLIYNIMELNKAISNDGSLGKGFMIGHSYFCNWAKQECTKEKMSAVVEHEIIPMLEEYWFDEESKLRTWKEKLLSVVG